MYPFDIVFKVLASIDGVSYSMDDKMRSPDKYFSFWDAHGNRVTFMVCFSKNNISIETGFIYLEDLDGIEKFIKKVGMEAYSSKIEEIRKSDLRIKPQ